MIAGIIGSTKIAKIHYENLVKLNYKKIYFISRNKSRAKSFIKNNIEGTKLCKPENYRILRKLKFDIIINCTNTEFHYESIKLIQNNQKFLIIEKPLISSIKFKKNYLKVLNKIYKNQKKLIVCYPMLFLGKSFLKNFSYLKKVKKLKIYYFTNGKHKYEKICEDLLPHGYSLAFSILKKINLTKKIVKIFSSVKKNSWYGKIVYQNLEIEFHFRQNKRYKKSNFYFKLNNELVARPTKILKNKFTNFLKFRKKKIEVTNPMSDFIIYSHKNFNNTKWLNENKNLTEQILYINSIFLKK